MHQRPLRYDALFAALGGYPRRWAGRAGGRQFVLMAGMALRVGGERRPR